MQLLAQRLGIVDYAKILAILLFTTSLFFMLIYPALESVILDNYMIAYAIFLIIYTTTVWYFMKHMDNLSTIVKKANFFVMLFIVLFVWDLLLPPTLVTTSGIPNLPANGLLSSDVFLYNLLPSFLPSIIRYWMTYSGLPSMLLTLVAVMAGTRKAFANMAARGI